MRITALSVHNFKRIKSLKIDADRGIIILGGKNGAGKSSVLDALTTALMGGGAIPADPIRHGAESGEVEVTLDGFTVKRTFTRNKEGKLGGTLTIRTADGMSPSSPQKWLDAKTGDLSCDPLAFMSATPEEQAKRLRKITGVDVSALDAKRKAAYDARAELGRDGKKEATALELMPTFPDAPTEPVDPIYVQAETVEPVLVEADQVSAAALLPEIAAAEATERAVDVADQKRAAAARGVAAARALVEATEAKVARIKAELDAALVASADAAAALLPAMDAEGEAGEALDDARELVVPSAPLKARIATIEAENKAARDAANEANAVERKRVADANAEAQRVARATNQAARAEADRANDKLRAMKVRKIKEEEVAALREAYAAKTAEIEAIDAEKAAMLAAASFPVDGLGFGADGGVTFQGVPLAQASGAERIRVSMAIALAANPQIRVVLIRDASLLDEDSMAAVVALAEAADAQVWLERVGTADPEAVVIVDGGTVE
jgi:DNA repair exonuclease SbcCD ATPase subunit